MKKVKKVFFILFFMMLSLLQVKNAYAAEVNTQNELLQAIDSGESIELANDIEIDATIAVKKEIELDLNGFHLRSNIGTAKTVFNISAGASLNIKDSKGTGKISTDAKWLFYNYGGNLTINGGNYILDGDFKVNSTTAPRYMVYNYMGNVDIQRGNFNITGTISNENSKYASKAYSYMFWSNSGTLNIGDNNTKDEDIVVKDDANVASGYIFYARGNTTQNISAGTFDTNKYLFLSQGTNREKKVITNITGGNFNSTLVGIPIQLYDYSKTTITDGTITTAGYGIFVSSYDYSIADPAVELVIGDTKGGNPIITADSFAIAGNNLDPGTKITINSGKIISKNAPAIYHPQQGIFIMNGGLVQGTSGIAAKMGQFEFNGGTVVGVGKSDTTSSTGVSGGTIADGAALSFSTNIYTTKPGVEEEYGNSLSVTINNGAFISEQEAALVVYDWNFPDREQTVKINIKDGRFTNFPVTKTAVYNDSTKISTIDSTKNYLSISPKNTVDNKEYTWVPQAYYNHGKLDYGFDSTMAPYYANLSSAIRDNRNEDFNSDNNIYYLQGKVKESVILEYTKLIHDWQMCQQYIPSSVINLIGDDKTFIRDTAGLKIAFDGYTSADILKDNEIVGQLYFPMITFDSNGGRFLNNKEVQNTIVTATSKIVSENIPHIILDNGETLEIETDDLLVLPENPTKENATFIGWYYDKDSTDRPVDFSTTKTQKNTVVYAHYKNNATDSTQDNLESPTNPNTLDNVKIYVISAILSLLAIGGLYKKFTKRAR